MIVKIKCTDVLWNYFNIGFSLMANVMWMPFLIYYLSPDMMGIWYIFVSVGGIVNLFDLGFSLQISRTVAYSWSGATRLQKVGVEKVNGDSGPNYELLHTVMKTCSALYLGIASFAFLVMMTAGSIYIYQITSGLMETMVYASWGIYMVSIFLNLYIGYYTVILRGIGDLTHMSQAMVMAKFAMIVIGIGSLVMGYGILGLSVSFLISGFVQRYLCRYYLKEYHKLEQHFCNIKIRYNYTRRYILNKMWHNAWRDGLVTVSFYLNSQAMILICGAFFSLAETGIYSLSVQIIGAIIGIATGMSNSYMPALQSAYAIKDKALGRVLIARSVTSYYLITFAGIMFFLLLGIDIIQWIKASFTINTGLFLLLAVHLFLLSRHQLSASYISTTNKLPYTAGFVISSIVSVLSAWGTVKYFGLGIYGLVLGPMIVQSVYNNWVWNTYVNRNLGVSEIRLLQLGGNDYWQKIRMQLRKCGL